uniref:Calcineurin-like phosphoesterase domain-containing protein n=1 Tax=Helicotheca tamesis TaxID=374047 RepID=A0A7S2HR38_9STRA|mmetsp:Transcript_20117/g.27591  ORF Transcript_20117/g.27591 Transcript_20117/m.27591 type:complete len:568 (+) Transcript_20117:66-1769(+)|eukprot:CAMPEP_0185729838 /NCGR_PEP_ID=MMETSP1171-20130828/7483_1 /TAXON_ID=374046 /ORGANISM="Helicotheca tamensis, Strain CCMP826" /LENGTH=567 /DNA_ID=CAMNT_0028398765 /DNA_START=23 /DNA_END=1726 /DNA_ORIENTATION=-
MKLYFFLPAIATAWVSTPSAPVRRSTKLMASDEYMVGVLGDLHMDPRKMEDYEIGRNQWLPIFNEAKEKHGNVALVSLGDLGESKSVRPEETTELFAGTTECHKLASDFLGSFGVPYEVIGGNHDLEGLDEFETDEENLKMFLDVHGKPTPHFSRLIADKTLLVGMTSTVFRDAQYTSHEVTVDDAQMAWFEETVKSHPASEGWKVIVFTHAPPNGSGLRVLQENHVVNGCCWLNHSNDAKCRKFIEIVRENRCVKAWFSGHFHLGQDYQDSITFPTIDPKDGPYPNRGACTFVQTSVMRGGTSRDGRQQSRLIRGNKDGFEICTVDHQKDGKIRIDATITFSDCNHEAGVYAHDDEVGDNDNYFKVYQPSAGDSLHPPDEGYRSYNEDGEVLIDEEVTMDSVAWWNMACGRVIGMLNGNLIEYDRSTLAPLGLIVGADELVGKRVAVIDSGIEGECEIDDEEGMEGADCGGQLGREQAVILYDATGAVTVVQPNEDGSFWRKIVRNKMVRMKEVRRVKKAKEFAKERLGLGEDDEAEVVSSWGPYTTTSGTAKKTGVAGLTAPATR